MTEPVRENEVEPELSPAAIQVQKKLRRLLLVSGLIMVMGFIAVFSTIIFRISRDSSNSETNIELPSEIILEKDTKIHSFHTESNLLYILTEGKQGNNLIVIDQSSGEIVSELKFVQK